MPLLLALDQGTTSSRAILFDEEARIAGVAQREFPQLYPQPGWVEHDPEAIWATQLDCARRVLAEAGARLGDVAAIGIANQRETALFWERATSRPICPAIVWQDRRTAGECDRLRAEGAEPMVRERTGLLLDPYFSATKLAWMLDHIDGARLRAERGELAFGTVDSFLLWRLTGGAVHATDVSNASRTLLFNLHTLDWDDDLLALFRIPRAVLPEVRPSCGDFGVTTALGREIPILGIAGDQQAATFGQACFQPGMVKNTYGTGSFLLMNTGGAPRQSRHRLLTTVGWSVGSMGSTGSVGSTGSYFPYSHTAHTFHTPTYALEGSVFVTGAAVQWLRDELGIIGAASEIGPLAESVADSGGVHFVPAFAGLGAPWWDAGARGAILGLTRGVGRAHIARAVLEAACFQSRDVIEAMQADGGAPLTDLRVDGGMTASDTMLQMQADILGIPVHRPAVTETTALGAASLAALAAGVWRSLDELAARWRVERTFEPRITADERDARYSAWRRAVARVRSDEHPA